MKKLISLLLLITSLSFAQNPVTQKRCFWGDKNPVTSPPTWSSKFLTGDYYLYSKDSSIYTYNSVSKVWALAVNGLRGGGGGRYLVTCVINGTGSLMAYYSDGTQDNLGVVVGMDGKDGSNGQNGLNGTNGANGQAATITVRNTTTLPAGSSAIVTNVGTSSNAVLDFGIPQGKDGSGGSGGNISVYVSTLQMLKSAQTTGIAVVMSFHAGSGYGSGMWYVDGNTSQADFVNHFKNSAGTSCWHRVSPKNCLDDVDFGAPAGTKTLAQLGYSQADINLLYDNTYAITPSDNADDAAHITTGKGWLKNYMCISQSPIVINIKRDVDMGKQNDTYGKAIVINQGNGMKINMLANNQSVYKRKASSFAEAEGNIGRGDAFGATSIHIDGYQFEGFGTNQTATDIDASYGSSVTRNHYNNVAKCIMQSHSMLTLSLLNIMWSPVKGYTNQSMYGIYPDATQENSGGNMSMILLNRVYATNNTDMAFETNRSSSPMYIQNIIEGASGNKPRIGINIDYGTGTTYKDGLIDGLHSEITALDAMIKLQLSSSGNFKIKNLWNQYPNNLIDPSATPGYPNVSVEDMNWLAPGTYFTKGTGYWFFDNCTENDLFQTSLWKGGLVPNFLTQIKHTGGLIQKSNYPFKFEGSMTLNGLNVATK